MKVNKVSRIFEDSFDDHGKPIIFRNFDDSSQNEFLGMVKVDFFCIYLILEGGGRHIINDVQYPIEAKHIHLVYPGQMEEINIGPKAKLYAIFIHRSFFSKISVHFKFAFSLYLKCPIFKLETVIFENISKSFKIIEFELAQRAVNMKIIRLHLILLSEIIRRESTSFLNLGNYSENSLLNSFLNLIEEHFREQKQVCYYAEKLNVTVNHLNLFSKRYVDCTASQLIFNRIIEEANNLLEQSNLSIKETAFKLGFSDASYFARFFKKQTGLSPKQFKNL